MPDLTRRLSSSMDRPSTGYREPVDVVVMGLLACLQSASNRADRPMPAWLRVAWLKVQSGSGRWSVADLAESVNVAPETLSRAFPTFFGVTPSECLRNHRLECAASRLRDGDEPIASVAYSLGFSDQSHFTNAFRARFGTPPGRFRRGRALRS